MKACLAVLMLWPQIAGADDLVSFNPSITETCLAAGGGLSCVRKAARDCIEADGYPAAGLCYGAEAAYWQQRIIAATDILQTGQEVGLKAARRVGVIDENLHISSVTAKWTATRDQLCDYAGAIAGDRGFGIRWIECIALKNGEHALFLEGLTRWIE